MSPTDAPPGLDAACDADDDAFVRRVNLLEILAEDSPETAPPPEEAARTWTEARIQKHYRTIGANGLSRDEVQNRVLTEKKVESLRSDPEVGKATTEDETLLPRREQTETTSAPAGSSRRPKRVRSNRASDFPEPDEVTFRRWFPGFERANAPQATFSLKKNGDKEFGEKRKEQKVRARVLCWPNAGNAEDVFTSERARVDGVFRNIPSPLVSWCRSNDAELLAVQLPGRAARAKEPAFVSARDAARALMPIVARRLFAPSSDEPSSLNDANDVTESAESASTCPDACVPWIVVGHSVGSWCAFEFVRLARSLGFPPPALACLSGFPAPDVPPRERPWTPNAALDDSAFKDECRGWGVDEAAFAPHAWRAFEPLLRADFTLFDAYEMDLRETETRGEERTKSARIISEDSEIPAEPSDPTEDIEDIRRVFPRLLTLRGTRDERITREAVSGWARFTLGPVDSRGAQKPGANEKKGGASAAETFAYRHVELEGAAHLVLTQQTHKTAWLQAVADALETVPRNA
jgi:surfactin synthase thioesterase subunit